MAPQTISSGVRPRPQQGLLLPAGLDPVLLRWLGAGVLGLFVSAFFAVRLAGSPPSPFFIACTAGCAALLGRLSVRLSGAVERQADWAQDRLRPVTSTWPEPWHRESVVPEPGGPQRSAVLESVDAEGIASLVLLCTQLFGAEADARTARLAEALQALSDVLDPENFAGEASRYIRSRLSPGEQVHVGRLDVDLPSGRYCLISDGSVTLAQFLAGSGRWAQAPRSEAPDHEQVRTPEVTGRLSPGDALVVLSCTGGPAAAVGALDRVLGRAETLVASGFLSDASDLLDPADGRSLVLLRR